MRHASLNAQDAIRTVGGRQGSKNCRAFPMVVPGPTPNHVRAVDPPLVERADNAPASERIQYEKGSRHVACADNCDFARHQCVVVFTRSTLPTANHPPGWGAMSETRICTPGPAGMSMMQSAGCMTLERPSDAAQSPAPGTVTE